MAKAILLSLLLIVCACVSTRAQETNVRIGARCGLSGGAGFENPICGFEFGGSAKLDKATLDGTAHYLFARKKPGNGHNVGGNLAARIQFRKMFAGPAASFHRQTTNAYVKSAFAIGAEVGKQFDSAILSVRVLQDLTSENRGRQYDVRLERYFKRLYASGLLGAQDFRCFGNRHCTSARAFVSAGVHF